MKKTSFLLHWVATFFLLIIAVISQAAEVKFSITPVLRAPYTLPANGLAFVQYMVTNNTGVTRELTTVPIPGVHHLDSRAPGTCRAPFVLAHGQSCLLILQLIAHEMVGGVHSGPVVCKTMGPGDNRPDAFLCSQPYPTDFMEINLSLPVGVGIISNPTSLTFPLGGTGTITITNTSTVGFAQHLDAHFIVNTAITLISNTCPQHLAPQASCVLTFTSTSPALATLSVMGTNSNQLLIPIAASSVIIGVSPNPLNIGVNNTRSVTVTNLSTLGSAQNVTANVPLGSNIQIISSNCPVSLAPGASCTINFTATGTQAGVNVPIQGTNTNTVNLLVRAQLLPISATPNLTLGFNQIGTVTVTNQSATDTAFNIQPTIPAGSGITAITSPACAALAPGASCTIQFSGSSLQPTGVNVRIQGTNTFFATVRIRIIQATLQVTPNPLALSIGGVAGVVTVTNTSTVAVTSNILPALGTTQNGITVNNNNCNFTPIAPLAPGGTCTISITPPAMGTSTLAIFFVRGATPNSTNVVPLIVTADDVVITVSPTSLTLTPGGQGQVTITNTSTTTAAINVVPTPDTLLQLNNCPAVLFPGANCTMIFFGNNNPPETDIVNISGSNTNTVPLTINTVGTVLTLSPGISYITVSPGGTVTTNYTVENDPASGGNASNITLILPPGWAPTVVQDASGCVGPIAPGASCNITLASSGAFLANNTIHAQDALGDTSNNIAIGFIQDGGYVFDITAGVVTVANTSDFISTEPWAVPPSTFTQTGATSTTDGQQNTTQINNSIGIAGLAAVVCSNNLTYLPASGQLQEMYNNLAALGLGNFQAETYWSSTEAPPSGGFYNQAYYVDFAIGALNPDDKAVSYFVRCAYTAN